MSNPYLQKIIDARLDPTPAVPRKQIMLHLPEDTIARLTRLAADLSAISGNRITRNHMIEDAIYVFLAEGEAFLAERMKEEEPADA